MKFCVALPPTSRRPTCRKNDVPARPGVDRRRDPHHGDVPGALTIARRPCYRWLATPVTDAEVTSDYRANTPFDGHRDDLPTGSFGSAPWRKDSRHRPYNLPVTMAGALAIPVVTTSHTPCVAWLESAALLASGCMPFVAQGGAWVTR